MLRVYRILSGMLTKGNVLVFFQKMAPSLWKFDVPLTWVFELPPCLAPPEKRHPDADPKTTCC